MGISIRTDIASVIFLNAGSRSSKPKPSSRRWHKALTAIYSSRVMLSVRDEILTHKKKQVLSVVSRNPSYTSLNVHSLEHAEGGNEARFLHIEAVTKIVKNRDMESLKGLGGLQGIAALLQTDKEKGINGNDDDVGGRQEAFGSNTYKKPRAKGFFYFIMEAFKDHMILILLACAVMSLVFGIKKHGIKEGWYDGGSIFIAIFLVIAVGAMSNFCQSRQFLKLSNKSNDISVTSLEMVGANRYPSSMLL